MENGSNKEVQIIDESYVKVNDSEQSQTLDMFQEKSNNYADQNKFSQLKNVIHNFFDTLKKKIFGNTKDSFPNLDFEKQEDSKQPAFSDFQNSEDQELSEMINELLQKERLQTKSPHQKIEGYQQLQQSLVPKQDNSSIKEVDENYEKSADEQSSQELEDVDLDEQQNQFQQDGDKESESESIKKSLETLVPSKDKGQSQEQDSEQNDGGKPNLDEQTPITAIFSDSDDLIKLNVNWVSEDRRVDQSRNVESLELVSVEDELLKKFLKYLIKTNYYVKTYGLDKKNKRQIAKHILLGLEHKILTDTYSNETQPLSFYIDMKGQCDLLREYNDFFRKLLSKKDVTVYFGYDGNVVKYLKVKKAGANLDFDRCDMCHYFQNSYALPNDINQGEYFESQVFDEHISLDEFILSHHMSRLIVFSDYDAASAVIKSSFLSKVYWFCTDKNGGDIPDSRYSLQDFRGEFIIADDISKIMEYFDHFGDPVYESKQRNLQLKR